VRTVPKSFKATLTRGGGSLNWTVVRIPLDLAKVWGTGRGSVRVKGEINGYAFRAALLPDGKGNHFLVVNRKMQSGGRVSLGAEAAFRIEPDLEPRTAPPMPRELERALREDKDLAAFFKSLSPSTRREIAARVAEAKQPETRRRRADQFAERLYQTMEAERGDLPPFIKSALARTPKAREGWEKMPSSHKRWHLLSIFYYTDPESRDRRIQKSIEMMVDYAERRESRKPRADDDSDDLD
jgi:uncharacterized protein YdeI (YjbR/CyaY-like superfamily)